MKYLSVCSGIEAATVAWSTLGWEAEAFAEIEPFPSSVLSHHYPNTPNFGDMTKFERWPNASIDILVGGTPCQDFSIAGLRNGLGGSRGQLMLVYGAIARKYRPSWVVWENVPGVLSINGGRDFASLLGLLSGRRIECPAGGWRSAGVVEGYERAYGLAWRVLDAQFVRVDGFARAVPQRRRRVFVVGHIGNWQRAAAVLFERESMCGYPPPRREAGARPSRDAKSGVGLCGDGVALNGIDGASHALTARHSASGGHDPNGETFVALTANDYGADAMVNVSPTIRVGGHPAVAYDLRGRECGAQFEGPHNTANIRAASGGSSRSYVQQQLGIRKLTPRECERLQGFPDDYTLVPYGRRIRPEKLDRDFLKYQMRGNPKHLAHEDLDRLVADEPRYKAIGNSMAVNCMRWIGRRVAVVNKL